MTFSLPSSKAVLQFDTDNNWYLVPSDSYHIRHTTKYNWVVTWHEYGIKHSDVASGPYGIYHHQHIETLPLQWQMVSTLTKT